MEQYLICLDIDGTLIGEDLIVSSRNQRALQTMITGGSSVFLVSGRMWYSAKAIATTIAPQVGVVASNGAVIDDGTTIRMTGLSSAIVQKLVRLSYQMNFDLFLFGQRKVYYTVTAPAYLGGDAGNRVHSPNREDYQQLTPFDAQLSEPVANGIVVDAQHPERLPWLRQSIRNCFGTTLKLSTSNVNNIELIPERVNKGIAIAQLQELTGIDAAHTVAIGDGENDLSMFAGIRYSVAMGNAAACVQRAAKHHTTDYQHDGVAAFLERHFLRTPAGHC